MEVSNIRTLLAAIFDLITDYLWSLILLGTIGIAHLVLTIVHPFKALKIK